MAYDESYRHIHYEYRSCVIYTFKNKVIKIKQTKNGYLFTRSEKFQYIFPSPQNNKRHIVTYIYLYTLKLKRTLITGCNVRCVTAS